TSAFDLMNIIFLIAAILVHQSLENLDQKCQNLNKNNSSCHLYFTCYPGKSNLTTVDIYLDRVTSLDRDFFQHINISNLILKNCKFDANISKNLFQNVESIENFSLMNVGNVIDLLNSTYLANKVINLKMSSIKINQIDLILKIFELSEIKENDLKLNLQSLSFIHELSIRYSSIVNLTVELTGADFTIDPAKFGSYCD
ncbi:hypothetical protein BpHYR1_033241, partial [Brachionus plicatilis]